MKTIKKIMMTVVLMTASLTYANDVSALIIKNDVSNTALVIENVNKGELVSIKDKLGHILYKEVVKISGTYTKGFDLTALPDGNYFFELNGDTEIKTIPFLVDFNGVAFNKTKETTIFKPVTELDENILLISKLSNNLDSLIIELYYEGDSGNYELINSETIKNKKSIKRIYRLSNNKKGNYKIVYNTPNRVFTEYINF